ncbi:MAG: alpha/beta fold hydrolase [Planctomycetaceae bacterium]|jgi:pimeloyl-ACP methyl ester carboxylesterase|nr:alpha/beta fold hydrolase [Planctomycetaceae bacterium]
MVTSVPTKSQLEQPTVVLVHGIGAHPVVMLPYQWALQRAGFKVHNFGYNSLRSMQRAADQLRTSLATWSQQNPQQDLHIVAHSMGCIVSRLALTGERPANFSRMVMLTPPSRGTPTANRFGPWLEWFAPSIQELRTEPSSLVNQLPPPDYPFALIKATWDFIIPSTHVELPGAVETRTFHGMHSAVLVHRPTMRYVAEFLRGEYHCVTNQ